MIQLHANYPHVAIYSWAKTTSWAAIANLSHSYIGLHSNWWWSLSLKHGSYVIHQTDCFSFHHFGCFHCYFMWFLPVFYGLIWWRLRLAHLNGLHQLVFGFSAFDRRYWFWGLIGRIFSSCLFIIYLNSNQIWSLFLFGLSRFSCSFLFLLTEIAAFVSCWWQVIIVGNWWLLNHHTYPVALDWSLCWSL